MILRSGWDGKCRGSITEGVISLFKGFEFHPEERGATMLFAFLENPLALAAEEAKAEQREAEQRGSMSLSPLPSWWGQWDSSHPHRPGNVELNGEGRGLGLSSTCPLFHLPHLAQAFTRSLPPPTFGDSRDPQSGYKETW